MCPMHSDQAREFVTAVRAALSADKRVVIDSAWEVTG